MSCNDEEIRIITEIDTGTFLLKLQKKFYEQEAVMLAAYKFTDKVRLKT